MRCLRRGSPRLFTFHALALAVVAATAFASVPTLHPNSAKYRESGATAASARAGDAQLHARALLGRSATDVEMSTAPFDGGEASGTIEKIQIKVTADGRTETTNHAGNGAAQGVALPQLPRGTGVQIQANVRSGQRVGVVTVEDTVKFRPDLAVTQIDLPSRHQLGSPAVISAVVSELNRDWGARADCVLRVNGNEVDRASGIWVDAAGVVSCNFTHRFASAGWHQVAVGVEGVVPGDYDLANNAAGRQIEIVSAIPDWTLGARDSTSASHTFSYRENEAGQRTWERTVDYSGSNASWNLQGHLRFYVPAMSAARMVALSDGIEICDFAATSFYENSRIVNYGGGRFREIHSSFAGDEFADFILISRERDVGDPGWMTTIMATNFRGEAAYLSRETQITFVDGVETDRAVWNWERFPAYGGGYRPLGNSVSVSLFIDGETLNLSAQGEIPQLEPFTLETNSPLSCSEFFGVVSCSEYTRTEQGKQGWVRGDFVY